MIDQYLVAALDKNSVIDVFIVRLGEKLAPNYADIVLFTKHANKLSLAKVTERSIGALGFQVCLGHDVLESLGEVAHVFGVVDFVGSVQQLSIIGSAIASISASVMSVSLDIFSLFEPI